MSAPAWRSAAAEARKGDFGIIGDPVDHSLSPAMQNPALERWWKRSRSGSEPAPRYRLFSVPPDEVPAAFDEFRRGELAGFNVTVPYKTAALSLIDRLDAFAAAVGAVNTVKREGTSLVGYNTDGPGFARALADDLRLKPKRALVIGAGGTGQVLVQQLLALAVEKIYWWNRSPQRLDALIGRVPAPERARVQQAPTERLRGACAEADLVVNATSVGLHPSDGLPAPALEFRAGQAAFDVVYHRDTAFLKAAREAGASVCGGLPMLLHQGAAAFEIWTGERAPVDLMKNALLKSVKEKGINPVWPSDI